MNKIIPAICVSVLIAMTSSCEKKVTKESSPKTNTQLLTEKPWKLISYGLDHNSNNYVEPSDEAIRDCDKDNTITFSQNGSGLVLENSQICTGNDAINHFSWRFFNNESGLDFEFGFLLISKLSTDSMRLQEEYNGPGRLILTYIH